MMGYQHALSGTAAGQAAVPWLEHTYGLTDGQMLLTVAVATGAAMVPDLDQAGSTIGRSLGPVTNVVAQLLGFLAGGHRNGTHSLLGIAGFTGVAALAADTGGWALAVVLWVILGVAVKAYGIGEAMNPAPRGVLRGLGRAVVNVVMLGVTLLILAPVSTRPCRWSPAWRWAPRRTSPATCSRRRSAPCSGCRGG